MAHVETEKEESVLNALKTIKEVEKASLTYGVFDLCVQVRFMTMDELTAFMFNTVRKIDGIKDTTTLISSKSYIATKSQDDCQLYSECS